MKKLTLFVLCAAMLLSVGCAAAKTPNITETPKATEAAQATEAPKTSEGEEMQITIEVRGESQSIEKQFTIKTQRATLAEVLEDNAEELGVTISSGDYGQFVSGMCGYVPTQDAKEYWQIFVNNESSMVGVSEIKTEEGAVYFFELTGY